MIQHKSHHFNINLDAIKEDGFNPGLLYFKYTPYFQEFDLKSDLRDVWKPDDPSGKRISKFKYLTKFQEIAKNINLSRLNSRMRELEGFANGNVVRMENQSRFLCGVGYQSSLEWGFQFDWTTGVPYLPGSSFKGAMVNYLEFCHGNLQPLEKWNEGESVQLENGDTWFREDIIKVFGSQGGSEVLIEEPSTAFFNVYPENFRGFEIDVITPHYKEYYESNGNTHPADIYNPVPIYFLTIAPGSKFLFLFKFRNAQDVPSPEKIKKLIIETGINFGFGAKTSSGYGYFKVPNSL